MRLASTSVRVNSALSLVRCWKAVNKSRGCLSLTPLDIYSPQSSITPGYQRQFCRGRIVVTTSAGSSPDRLSSCYRHRPPQRAAIIPTSSPPSRIGCRREFKHQNLVRVAHIQLASAASTISVDGLEAKISWKLIWSNEVINLGSFKPPFLES